MYKLQCTLYRNGVNELCYVKVTLRWSTPATDNPVFLVLTTPLHIHHTTHKHFWEIRYQYVSNCRVAYYFFI